MSEGRRHFLKLFGLSSAAVASTTLDGEQFEKIEDKSIQPHKQELGSYIPNLMDVRRGQLYSALTVMPESFNKRHTFFRYGLGAPNPYETPWAQMGSDITLADTNMERGSSLPPPCSFAVERIGMLFSPACDPVARSKFIERYSLSVWIGNKTVDELEPNRVNPKVPTSYMVDTTPLPLILQTAQQFHAELEGSPFYVESSLRMWCVFDGMHALGVQ